MRVRTLAALVIAALAGAGMGTGYLAHGHLNAWYCPLSFFFSINMVICYWEACLIPAVRRHRKARRLLARASTGRSAAAEFLATRVPLRHCVSPTLWADICGTYALYDGSYADGRTYGFNADVVNGFFTGVPTLVLHTSLTIAFLPAVFAGILGVMLFWQWTDMTAVYNVSFFSAAGRSSSADPKRCSTSGVRVPPG